MKFFGSDWMSLSKFPPITVKARNLGSNDSPPVGGPWLNDECAYLSVSKAFEGCLTKRYQGYTANQVEYATD